MPPGMITFRCWYCNRRHTVGGDRIGERTTCECKRLLRVPERSNGKCRVKTPLDWVVEALVYGVGGALLGVGFGVLIIAVLGRAVLRSAVLPELWIILPALGLLGLLVGLFGGERGINWIGRKIRDWEES